MLLNEIKKSEDDVRYLYKKYNFIYKNGFFIQSSDYSYYISNNKCALCPDLRDILIISKK